MESEKFKEQFANWKAPEPGWQEKIASPELILSARVHSYLDGVNPQELQQRVLHYLDGLKNPMEQKLILRNLNIGENCTNEELQEAISEHIRKYQQRVKEVQTFIPEHLITVNEWLRQQGLTPQQNPEDIPVYVTDSILHHGVKNELPIASAEAFDAQRNIITITGTYGPNILAHEYFHGMSHNEVTKDTGFAKMIDGKLVGNKWLDGGVTMIGEFATYPTQTEGQRDEIDEMYDDGYRWITDLYARELGISQTSLLKAYFGEEPYRSDLEGKTKERFGCTISELNDLFFGYDEQSKEQIVKIVKGEPVVLEAMEGSGMDEVFYRLQRIFPHIEVVMTPRPVF